MSFQLHPQEEALRVPDSNCSQDHWCYKDPPYYGWATCRHNGASELLRKENRKRLLCYRFGNGWYSKPDAPYTDRQVIENIARLFQHVEDKMDWWDRTRIHPTEHLDIVNVYFSGGWLQNKNAAWLGTLMLRLGGHFGPNRTLDWTLKQHNYGAETVPAIQRFLQGYQHYMGESEGWYDVFCHRPWERVCSMLVHTDDVREKAYLLAEADRFKKKPGVYWLNACRFFQQRCSHGYVDQTSYNAEVTRRWPDAA